MNLKQTIAHCKKRKPKAEKELFYHFAPRVFALCQRYSRDDSEAKDFLQECFLRVFDQIHQYDPERGAFEGWLYRVCTNVVLQQLRRNKREQAVVLLAEVPDTEVPETIIRDIPQEKILEAIRSLPEGYQEVFNLYIFEQWSHEEIGRELGISASTSRSQLARAKRLLKKKLLVLIPNIHERLA
ncbi:MAG: sigma-70 family RNA polymerase sigma factor [Phaeodactylibacter sp.]|nr:sigma-70 family RNA polymerase sigma factor [Phaeodactylibacter sp.]